MENTNQKKNDQKYKMGILQDQLDIAVFEQEEVDPRQVKTILQKMEQISPRQEDEQERDLLWERIREECREEFEADEKASKSSANGKHGAHSVGKNSAKIRKFALMAATLVLAVFIGANIGTYATEKKNLFEYVGGLKNGTSFRVSGDDTPGIEMNETTEVYYSWNDIPEEYKKFLILPYGMPDNFQFYDVKIFHTDTAEVIKISYITDNATDFFDIDIYINENNEFTFGNLLFENEYTQMDQETIDNVEVLFFENNDGNVCAQFSQGACIYNLYGSITLEEMRGVLQQTLEGNFMH